MTDTYRGRAQLRSRAHDREAAAGRGSSPAPAPGRLEIVSGSGENDYFHGKTPTRKNFTTPPDCVTAGGTGPPHSSLPLLKTPKKLMEAEVAGSI